MNKQRLFSLLTISLMLFCSTALADDGVDTMNPAQEGPEVQKMIQFTPANLQRAAVIACLQRGWAVTSVSDSKITGTYKDSKLEMLIADGTVTAKIVEGTKKQRWVEGLTRDTFVALLYLSK